MAFRETRILWIAKVSPSGIALPYPAESVRPPKAVKRIRQNLTDSFRLRSGGRDSLVSIERRAISPGSNTRSKTFLERPNKQEMAPPARQLIIPPISGHQPSGRSNNCLRTCPPFRITSRIRRSPLPEETMPHRLRPPDAPPRNLAAAASAQRREDLGILQRSFAARTQKAGPFG